MKKTFGSRIMAIVLVLSMILVLIPVTMPVEADAISGLSSLTCAGFISNTTRQQYIDTMMRYYINNSSNLQSALNSGKSAVFMFEGGSDYYDTYEYVDGGYQTRLQAVCIVVQLDSSGNAKIVFYSEKCSSIPDNANYVTEGYETSGSTTILDGIYKMTTVNHNGNYAAHTTNCYTGWYNPYAGSTGYSDSCIGINIHTRGVSYCYTGGGNSMGCQLIGYGASSSNDYNSFMKVVTGCTFNAYDGTQRTFSYTGSYTGYYVLDRQLALTSPSGVDYGSGSLTALYTKADLAGITQFSTNARANADFGYLSKCTVYPSYCQIKITDSTPVNSLPCSTGTDDSETIENASVGAVYTATKLYKNTYGNLWYEVKTASGDTGHVYAGDAEYVKQFTSDIKLSGATYPNGHVAGNYFVVNGTISSGYNQLSTVAVYVHSGFGTSGAKTIGSSATVNGKSYTLASSAIDSATAFDSLTAGKYTYAIYASYINYYATDATTLKSNTGTMTLMDEYFVVVSSSVAQSSCSHSNSTTTVSAATCTTSGVSVTSCSKCGLITENTVASKGHSYGSWTTTTAATCVTDGSKTRACSVCGKTETQTIAAGGHAYSLKKHAATCKQYEIYEYTCSTCGDNFKLNAGELASGWIDYLPVGLSADLFRTKTQYRYSDYQTTTSYNSTMAGYTEKSSEWVQTGTKTVAYVNSWPSGFSTSNSLYTKYNNKSAKVTASTTNTSKVAINSDKVVGYLYYHWCYTDSYYSRDSKTGDYTTFHAYYSTTAPGTYNCDTGDMSYCTSHSGCSNTEWYFVAEVYEQSSTSYSKLFTYERWTDFSAWSDTAVTATTTREVENRTVYQLLNASLGTHTYVNGTCSSCGTGCSHTWNNGACSVCGQICSHSYAGGYCSVCGMASPVKDYYLFGYINGGDYACEGDYENIGIYKFVDGKLTATFTTDSYVGVKTSDNSNWYMTNGWLGYDTTSATLYNTSSNITNADKLYVPGGVEVTFTLVVNEDDTLTLSYVAQEKELVKPTITPKYPSLSFEGEIFYNITFVASDVENAVEWGLITFESNVTNGTVDNADYVIPGHTYDATSGYYKVRSNGIAAKKLGDTLYFRVYAKLTDGTYTYSGTYNYSAMAYAKDRLANSTNEKLKCLCVAMVNYGTAAQNHFGHNTATPMNGFLTSSQAALVQNYSSNLVAAVGSVDSSKNATLSAFSGYSNRYPSVSFEGAFGISYYFTPSNAMDNGLNLYYWTAADYAAATTLSPNNASGKLAMEATGVGSYKATVAGIAAKEIDSTIYVVGIYFSGGTMHCTGVLPYSLGSYCVDRAANGSGTMQALAKATAVYGYYAKQYFSVA